jgi:hypothetical protein
MNLFNGNAGELREDLVEFIRANPICDNDGSKYKDFFPYSDEDSHVAYDQVMQKDLQWETYLLKMQYKTEWGDEITLKALANRFKINVHVISCSSESDQISTHPPCSEDAVDDIYLGNIVDWHYVAFDRFYEWDESQVKNKKQISKAGKNTEVQKQVRKGGRKTEVHISTSLVGNKEIARNICNTNECVRQDNDSDDEIHAEEEESLERIRKTCGLPYESGFFSKDSNFTNKTLCCAPGEKHKPIPLLSDKNFEELSNPEKFPNGEGGLVTQRIKNIDDRRYFNQRLLDVDGRFARSTDYLLSVQYAIESKQVQGNINHYCFRRAKARHHNDGKTITAATVKDADNLRQLVKKDQAYKVFKNVRGSPAYFQTLFYDILAMMAQLGTPTFFFTISAADMQWPDLIQTIARQYGTILSDEDVKGLSYDERCTWLRSNPVTAVRHFHYRLETFFKHVIMSGSKPLGDVVDYAIRVEFQARGSPHAHTLLWVKDAPQIGIQEDDEVKQFVQKHIYCCIPDIEKHAELVLKLQKHSHSSYCRKKGTCRFGYPKPVSDRVILAREPDDEDEGKRCRIIKEASSIMTSVYEVLMDKDLPDNISTEEVLSMAKVKSDDYYKALSVAVKGRKLILPRTPAERCINPYNPTCLYSWQANMDIQYVEDAYACIMYIGAYISKDETGMGELLKQVSKECGELDIQSKLRRLGSAFLNNREVSAQEAAMRILSIPMRRLSRVVTFINTDPLENRTLVLKPKAVLDQMEDDSEDIFQSNIISRYSMRPAILENRCLAFFASYYTVSKCDNESESQDHEPHVLENEADVVEDRNLPKKIKLRNSSEYMHKRRKQAVIRFRKFNPEKELQNYCRAKLMLFLPWRDEERDLLKDYPDYHSHYIAVLQDISEQESNFTVNLNLANDAIERMENYGPPSHAWDLVAPEAVHHENLDRLEGVDVEREMAQE